MANLDTLRATVAAVAKRRAGMDLDHANEVLASIEESLTGLCATVPYTVEEEVTSDGIKRTSLEYRRAPEGARPNAAIGTWCLCIIVEVVDVAGTRKVTPWRSASGVLRAKCAGASDAFVNAAIAKAREIQSQV